MHITNSTSEDLELIFEFYASAVEFQRTVFHRQWQGFDRHLVEMEIREGRQWKIIEEGRVACIFAITFQDAAIWGERDRGDGIYIHRITTHPDFRGRHLVDQIAAWAKGYARSMGRLFVRMDTWGDNEKLIAYYQTCGFRFLGIVTPDFSGLPKHYEGITLSLFEMES